MRRTLLRARIDTITLKYNGDDESAEEREIARLEPAERQRRVARLRRELAAAERAREQARGAAISSASRNVTRLKDRLRRVSEKDNSVTAVLDYPRSGESRLMSHRQLNIPGDNEPFELPDEFLESALFKEEIQGETMLQILVTDKDRNSGFLKFLRDVLSAVFSSVVGDAIKGISEIFVSKAADNVGGRITKELKGDDKDSRVIGLARSRKIEIQVDADGGIDVRPGTGGTYVDGKLALPLLADRDFRIRRPGTDIAKGDQLGEIVLVLEAEAFG
ncbi:MAG: hypothetical protein AAGN46_00975 [Acidobacteriota bacterium]